MAWKPGNRDLEVVSEILSSLELGELALRETFRLSGGQRQKVSIARALAQEPEVLLLDEPTSSLDLRHQLEVMDLVADQARKGITAVAALHDLNLALRFSDRVAMLKEGRIYASGGPDIVTAKRVAEVYGVQVEISSREAGSIVVPTGPA
jgi:iron complex transport system ATP-binding protein